MRYLLLQTVPDLNHHVCIAVSAPVTMIITMEHSVWCKEPEEEDFRVQQGQNDGQPQQEPAQAEAEDNNHEGGVAGGSATPDTRSRKMLSSSATTPDWLKRLFPMPADEIILSHIIHKTSVLPHFQVRMVAGDVFDGKCLC